MKGLFYLALILLSSCSPVPKHAAYRESYAHLNTLQVDTSCPMQESDYFLIILVNARHLDYTNNRSFFKTLVKHPSDGSKNGDVGHAWIYLEGMIDGERVYVEGGHSGERGIWQARYFDGVMNSIECGYANPTPEERRCPRDEPNPIKYLWATQCDGYFQEGCGRHRPTFAAKIDLSEEQFKQILTCIDPANYCYRDYAITRQQCSSFVAKVAAIGGVKLESRVKIRIDQELCIGGDRLVLWEDPRYSEITISSPDIVERSLMEAVCEGRAEYALSWYERERGSGNRNSCEGLWEKMRKFPERAARAWRLR